MTRLFRKLKHETGASLVLVLLFMLVCMTVGGSVLLAATANAGKLRGDEQETQAYLALASALQTVSESICSTEYAGTYQLSVSEGTTPSELICTYAQQTGSVTAGSDSCFIFLRKDLDCVFAQYLSEFAASVPESTEPPSGAHEPSPSPTFRVEADPLAELSGYQPGLPCELRVTSQLSDLSGFEVTLTAWVDPPAADGTGGLDIHLTAVLTKVPDWFDDDAETYKNYRLKATLIRKGNFGPLEIPVSDDVGQDPRNCESTSLHWELDSIGRE